MDLLKQAGEKAEAAELYVERRDGTTATFDAGDLETVKAESVVGQALRVIKGGRLGFAATTGNKANGLLDAALLSAQHGDPAPFRFPEATQQESLKVYDREVAEIPDDKLVLWGEEAVKDIHAEFPDVQVNIQLSRGTVEVSVGGTASPERKEKRSSLAMEVEAEWVRQDDVYSVHASQSVRSAAEFDPQALVADVLRQLHWGKDVAPTPTGEQPVLFLPDATPVVFLPLFVGFSGMSVYLGTSPLKDKVGEQLFDQRLSLTDDGRLELGPRSSSFDDEGVSTTQLPLVDQGVVRGYFYDLRAAALAGAEPTGNGLKGGLLGGGFRTPPSASPRHLVVRPGAGSLDELLKEMGSGLVAQNVLGLGQGNIASGAFSNNVIGYAVRDGKVIGRVKNTMIAGNAYELLKGGLQALGGDPEWVFGMLHTPPILIKGVSVVTR
ncbi:MAG: metallopeptidase TldD-related protein [Candidatus Bipolaricaulota bacterium]